jgi:hypothetical protein
MLLDLKNKDPIFLQLNEGSWETHLSFPVDVLKYLKNLNVILQRKVLRTHKVIGLYSGTGFQNKTALL